jgi:eukaryotic-like serine/threonine-protein kinase
MSQDETVHRIGDYEILGVLGAGGMGKVFKVRNVISDRIEAMKILLPDLAGQKELADRFLREIKLLASLNHPNIASLRTALTIGNQLVMIMEFVEGTTLAARVEQGPVSPADAVDYIDQVLVALSYAHRQQIIHRDIKPANMMLTPQGLVKLMDFGIARSGQNRGMTMTGTTLGSLYYMSPEQVKGEGVDARSDLYSVGVSLYELVTGRKPFQAESNYSLMSAHLQQAPTPPIELQPGLPSALNQVILMGLAKDPAQRFQSADAFRNALKSVAEGLRKPAEVAAVLASQPAALGATAVFQEQLPPASAAGPVAAPARTPVQASVQASAGAPLAAAIGTPSLAPGTAPGAGVAEPAAQAAAQPISPAAKPGGYRGFYMTLGALVVLAVLVTAGVYVPRWEKARAGGRASQSTQQPSNPAPSTPASPADTAGGGASQSQPTNPGSAAPSGSQQPATNASEGQSSSSQPSNSASNPAPAGTAGTANPPAGDSGHTKTTEASSGEHHHPSNPPRSSDNQVQSSEQSSAPSSAGSTQSGQPQGGAQQVGGTGNQAPAADSAELDELEHQMDQLSSRATAAHDGVENLRRAQSQQGLNLRGDISAAEDRMGTYMGKAQAAFQNQDSKSTKKYMELAETEVETLEKFLGRR